MPTLFFPWDANTIDFDAAERVILDTLSSSHHPQYMRDMLIDPKTGAVHLHSELGVHHALRPGPAKWPQELAEQIVLPPVLAKAGLAIVDHQAPSVAGFLRDHGFSWQKTAAGGFQLFHGLKRSFMMRGVSPKVARAHSCSKDEAKA